MARRTRTSFQVREAAPTVQRTIESLRSQGSVKEAEAVQVVLDFALQHTGRVVMSGKPVAIPLESGLHLRAYQSDKNLTELVEEGWDKFLAGEWEPERPRPMFEGGRAAYYGKGGAATVPKTNLNIRTSQEKFEAVEAAAGRLVEANGWPTKRGYMLNARNVAAQWLALQFPDPAAAAGESEAAAE